MQICTNFTCLLVGILAIIAAIIIFYFIGLLIARNNNHKNSKHKPITDKDYRADRPNRHHDDQTTLKSKPKEEIFNNDEDEVM